MRHRIGNAVILILSTFLIVLAIVMLINVSSAHGATATTNASSDGTYGYGEILAPWEYGHPGIITPPYSPYKRPARFCGTTDKSLRGVLHPWRKCGDRLVIRANGRRQIVIVVGHTRQMNVTWKLAQVLHLKAGQPAKIRQWPPWLTD